LNAKDVSEAHEQTEIEL